MNLVDDIIEDIFNKSQFAADLDQCEEDRKSATRQYRDALSKVDNELTKKERDQLRNKHLLHIWQKEGEIYQQQRESLGLSRIDVANEISISETTLHRFEQRMPVMNKKFIVSGIRLVFKIKRCRIALIKIPKILQRI
jgi:ribosome-binding protein aMBF1 (putative translation factor)